VGLSITNSNSLEVKPTLRPSYSDYVVTVNVVSSPSGCGSFR